MNSEANSEIALRYYCAIDQAAGIKPENKLERPAYFQLIGLRHSGAVLHGHFIGKQNEAVIRRPHSALFNKKTRETRKIREMTLHYSCAIEPMWEGGSGFLFGGSWLRRDDGKHCEV